MSEHRAFRSTRDLSKLDDRHILELLEDLRARAKSENSDLSEIGAGIAELEAEAARRRLELPAVVELMPEPLALHRFEHAVAEGDLEAAGRAVFQLRWTGLWCASRRARDMRDAGARIYVLERILFCVECNVLGEIAAEGRRQRIGKLRVLGPRRYEEYLLQCLDALFAYAMIHLRLPY